MKGPRGTKTHQSIYLSTDVLAEAKAEAERLGLSLSGVIQAAWRIAHTRFSQMPDVEPWQGSVP